LRLILDTSFLIELRKRNKVAFQTLEREKEGATDVSISVLTLYELLVGAEFLWMKRRDPIERFWVERLLRWVSVLSLDEQVVKRASKLRARAMLEGKGFPDLDLLIALSQAPAKLLTADEDHMKMKEYLEEEGVEVISIAS